jgi:hypothetical protein
LIWLVFFSNEKSTICFNGIRTSSFPIKREVKQGCPLVPYFFLLMGEVFNIMIKQVTKNGEIKGILFLGKEKEQIIDQYVDDTSFALVGHESNNVFSWKNSRKS